MAVSVAALELATVFASAVENCTPRKGLERVTGSLTHRKLLLSFTLAPQLRIPK